MLSWRRRTTRLTAVVDGAAFGLPRPRRVEVEVDAGGDDARFVADVTSGVRKALKLDEHPQLSPPPRALVGRGCATSGLGVVACCRLAAEASALGFRLTPTAPQGPSDAVWPRGSQRGRTDCPEAAPSAPELAKGRASHRDCPGT